MELITFTNKKDRIDQSPIPVKKKVVAADMNEIKKVVNAIVALINDGTLRQIVNTSISAANFSGDNYDNSNLVNLTPYADFNVYTNEGSGVLLQFNDGYTYNAPLGRLTMPPGKYLIQ